MLVFSIFLTVMLLFGSLCRPKMSIMKWVLLRSLFVSKWVSKRYLFP